MPVLFTVSAEFLIASKPGGAGLQMNAFCHCTKHFNIYDAEFHRGTRPECGDMEISDGQHLILSVTRQGDPTRFKFTVFYRFLPLPANSGW